MSGKDNAFVLVEASKLSMKDKFMQYYPETNNQRVFMERLIKVIENGIADFYAPVFDPSFSEDSNGIRFVPGQKPAMGKEYSWWKKVAEDFLPEENSRLGTKDEYIAFVGVIIKMLVEKGWAVSTAWYVVCNDSKSIGKYRNSIFSRPCFENTGSKEICGFYDLANTFKMLDSEGIEDGFYLASGAVNAFGDDYPVAKITNFHEDTGKYLGYVGWIIVPFKESAA